MSIFPPPPLFRVTRIIILLLAILLLLVVILYPFTRPQVNNAFDVNFINGRKFGDYWQLYTYLQPSFWVVSLLCLVMAIITFFSFLSTQQTFKSNLSSAAVVIMLIAFVVSLPVSLWEMIDPIGPARTYIHVDSIETKNEIYHLTQFDDIDGMSYLVLLFRCDKSHKACLMLQNKSLNPTTAYAASQVSLSIDQDSKKLNILTDGKIFYTYDITLNFP